MVIIFGIFVIVALCFEKGQITISSPANCSTNFREWKLICTNDRKHCYYANMQPKLQTTSKPTKRFSAKNETNDHCESAISDEGRKEFAVNQFEDGTFLEDISFEKWINQNEFCKKIDNSNECSPKNPPTYEELESLDRLNLPAEMDLDMENGWKMSLKINPRLIACDPKEHNLTRLKPKKVKTIGCNEDGSDCKEYWKEVFNGEYEGIDKNNPLPTSCQRIPEWDRKVKCGLFLICYESKLDPNNSVVEPRFAVQNIDGNDVAKFCQEKANLSEKIWHGIAIKFWVTLTNNDLLVDMQIHFSYNNKSLILPTIEKYHKRVVNMTYEFMFNKSTTILDPYGIIHDDFPAVESEHIVGQNESDLWLTFLDMPTNISSMLFFSGEDCNKWKASLNSNWSLMTEDCISSQEKMDQIIKREQEERKKVDAVMEQIRELRRKCNVNVTDDPEIPTDRMPPPELINHTRPYNPEEEDYNGYGDVLLTMKEAQEELRQIREKCGYGNMSSTEMATIVEIVHSADTDTEAIADEGNKNLGHVIKNVDEHADGNEEILSDVEKEYKDEKIQKRNNERRTKKEKKKNMNHEAGFWLAFLDMPTNISSILFFGETCSKIEASLNGNWSLLTAKCHQWKEELEENYRKMAEEQKKVKVIMEQINELIRNCHLFTVDPNMPDIKPPPELIRPTDNYDGEQQLNQWGYYGDIIFGLEETQRILEQIREECGFGNMTTTENTVTIVQKFHSDFDAIEDEGDKNLGKAKIVDVHGDRIKKSPLDTDNENGENLLEGN